MLDKKRTWIAVVAIIAMLAVAIVSGIIGSAYGRGGLDARVEALNQRTDRMDERDNRLEIKVDRIFWDIQLIKAKMGIPETAE